MTNITKSILFCVLLLLVASVSTGAQNRQLKGSVVDNKSGEVLPFANVALMRPADTVFMRGATTDLNGRFCISEVDTGHYLLQVSYVGYQTIYQPYAVSSTMPAEVDMGQLRLHVSTMMQEVVVRAERPLYAMDGEKNLYNTKEDPSIQTGTASDALQNAPGVEVDAEGNITLRGVSSVEIWINNRPSHMNEEALKQYIKQLPANAIDRIEVITNPSARYSTSGGVINIVTNQKITRNELLCLGVRARTSPSLSPWASYVWSNEKVDFNFYLNADMTRHTFESDGSTLLFDDNGDTSRYQEYATDGHATNKGGYFGFNFNWNIDSKTSLSAWMGAYPYWTEHVNNASYRYDEYQPSFLSLGYNETSTGNNFTGGGYMGAWFQHQFDTTGRKLSANYNASLWLSNQESFQDRDYNLAALTDFHRRGTEHNFGPSLNVGIDYTLPLKHDIEIETGAEVSYNQTPVDIRLDSLNAAGIWDMIPLRCYEGNGVAWQPQAYITAQKRWGTFTAKLGLRAEGLMMNGDVSHGNNVGSAALDTAFFGLVPSIHLSYRTKDFSNYSVSYTRRYSAPTNLLNLIPFRIYDDYSYSTGNPNLRLSYAHNVEAAWSKYFMKFGSIGVNAYWRANTDEVGTMTAAGMAPEYFGSLLVNYTYPDNIGSSHTEGVEANVTYRPNAFVNVRLNGTVFNYGYTYNDDHKSKISYSARLNVWAKLWKRLEVFANARYTSPRLGLYSLTNPNMSVDFGLSSDFFNRKLSVYLNVNDIFGKSEWGSNTEAPQYQTTGSRRYDSRFVSLGLTWRIGKMELESKARQGATDAPMGQPGM